MLFPEIRRNKPPEKPNPKPKYEHIVPKLDPAEKVSTPQFRLNAQAQYDSYELTSKKKKKDFPIAISSDGDTFTTEQISTTSTSKSTFAQVFEQKLKDVFSSQPDDDLKKY